MANYVVSNRDADSICVWYNYGWQNRLSGLRVVFTDLYLAPHGP